jgi:uncharacterized small protein (TIGR04563 family)
MRDERRGPKSADERRGPKSADERRGPKSVNERRGPKSAGQKVSLSVPIWMSRELENEAARLDRSVSWILRRAWRLARAEVLRANR